MNTFDQTRMEELTSLVELRPTVHFPFFANTFSLPFHYANRLHSEGNGANIVRDYLKEHRWEIGVPTLDSDRPNVFYATTASRIGSEKQLETDWRLYHEVFTHYVPGFVFIKPQLSFLDQNLFSKNFVKNLNNHKVKSIELFTDIPKQSDAIVKKLSDWNFEGNVQPICEPVDALLEIPFQENTLKLYFYGAPATTHMRNNPFDYQALKVKDGDLAADEHTKTEICLAIPRYSTLPDSDCEQVMQRLKAYHHAIFEMSEEEKDHTRLRSILLAYNQYAERKQHSATFLDTEQFAKCLREHHRPV